MTIAVLVFAAPFGGCVTNGWQTRKSPFNNVICVLYLRHKQLAVNVKFWYWRCSNRTD